MLADAAAEDGQQQRKRRGRIGNMVGEPSASTRDNQGLSAVEPAEDMLTDSLDGDRSNGEMLMECVVKVSVCAFEIADLNPTCHLESQLENEI